MCRRKNGVDMIALWHRLPGRGSSVQALFVQKNDFLKMIGQSPPGEKTGNAGADDDGAALLRRNAYLESPLCCFGSV